MFAVVDCDNCFVSCERVFQPELRNRPVVVLSNNDGCVVARSNEAKALGIKMGVPVYQIQSLVKQHDVQLRSSNYILYADMSNRVMSILRDEVGQGSMEIYSIDEAFLTLPESDVVELRRWGEALVAKIGQWTGMPVSIGIAPTRTLAKAATWFAKKYKGYNKVCIIATAEQQEKALKALPMAEVWGIGWRGQDKCRYHGIATAWDFTQRSVSWVRGNFSVTGLRTRNELLGNSCIETLAPKDKQSICTSRSFDGMVDDYSQLEMFVTNYAAHCAQKLRSQHSVCQMVSLFLQTNHFRPELLQMDGFMTVTLATAASSTTEIVQAAQRALKSLYRTGYYYKRAGVIVSAISSEKAIQMDLFDELTPEQRQRLNQLSKVMDFVNHRMGNDTIQLGIQQFAAVKGMEGKRSFKDLIRHDHRSRCYTTNLNEIIEAK